MKIALFDFDGTITKNDSLLRFIRFVVGDFQFFFGMLLLSPILAAYKLKLTSNFEAKQKVLSWFFNGMNEEAFFLLAKKYSLTRINKILRAEAMEKIEWHQQQGHKVIVVSASLDCWLRPWCEKHGLDLLATKLEIKNGKITGRFHNRNCYGQEKVNRIKEVYNLKEYDYIYAYGDSKGDKEMLSLANESFYQTMN